VGLCQFYENPVCRYITHIRVAEILRYLAGLCSLVQVYDEADYYETRDRKKKLNAFGECSKLINSVIGKLKEAGWKEENILKGRYQNALYRH